MAETQEGWRQAATSAPPRLCNHDSPSAVALRMRRYRERQKEGRDVVSAEVDIMGLADFLKREGYLPRGVNASYDDFCAATSMFLSDLIKDHYA